MVSLLSKLQNVECSSEDSDLVVVIPVDNGSIGEAISFLSALDDLLKAYGRDAEIECRVPRQTEVRFTRQKATNLKTEIDKLALSVKCDCARFLLRLASDLVMDASEFEEMTSRREGNG